MASTMLNMHNSAWNSLVCELVDENRISEG